MGVFRRRLPRNYCRSRVSTIAHSPQYAPSPLRDNVVLIDAVQPGAIDAEPLAVLIVHEPIGGGLTG